MTVLEAALGLPEMIAMAARSRACAADTLKMFRDHMLAHHDDEERDLFPAVLHELVRRFNEHVRLEEEQFLPFAQQVLARQSEDLAMLGAALHRRHEAEEIMSTAVVYGAT